MAPGRTLKFSTGVAVRRAVIAGARAWIGRRAKRYFILAGLMVTLLLGVGCSSGDGDGRANREEGEGERDSIIKTVKPVDTAAEAKEANGGLGEAVEVGGVSLRVIDVRSRDRIYAIAHPGAEPVTKGGGFGEFVAVDYVARNVSGSPLTTHARATLVDEQGDGYGQAGIEPPAGGLDDMKLGTGQRWSSTMFFQVPNGISPERLEVRTRRDVVRIDLLETHPEGIPPEDYLRVYHLYFNEKASEEAYEMFDPASVENITLGEWMSFYEPLWGKRYVSLDNLRRLSLNGDRATFALERTFYDGDGNAVPDPEVGASVVQEMVKTGEEWKLVMGEDLISDIIAVIGPDKTPPPKATTPEKTPPKFTQPEETTEETVPERTEPVETTAAEATTVADQAPEEVLASQYELVNAGVYAAAYALFDSGSQQLVSPEEYGAYFESLAPYEITAYSFSSTRVQGETATVVVDLTVSSAAGVEQYQVSQQMVLEDGSWRAVMREEQVAAFTRAG
jgi:hypothetical protein